jgi:hypothetical protein
MTWGLNRVKSLLEMALGKPANERVKISRVVTQPARNYQAELLPLKKAL